MRTAAGICLAVLLAGCAHQDLRFQMRVSDLIAGNQVPVNGLAHAVEVYCPQATAALRPESVDWHFDGAFAPGPSPGTFVARGPGTGSISAGFVAGDRQVLKVALIALAAPTPAPTAAPIVRAAPTPVPTGAPAVPATPEPDMMLNSESLVLDAYKYADSQDYWAAISNLVLITDPEWMPKVRALMTAWGEKAVDQGLALARQQLRAENRQGAIQTLETVAKLPRKPSQRQAERALRATAGL